MYGECFGRRTVGQTIELGIDIDTDQSLAALAGPATAATRSSTAG